VDATKIEAVKKIQEIKEKYGDVNLIDMLHQYLIEEDQRNQQKRYDEGRIGKFYPSSVGSCKRKVAYQMMGYPGKPKQGRSVLILDNGTYFHNRMEEYFEKMGIMVAPELKLKDTELRISGRSDAIIYNFMKKTEGPIEGDEMIKLFKPVYDEEGTETGEELVYEGWASDVLIVEFKSAKEKSYEDYTPKTKPQKKHEMQLQLYFYLTGIRAGMVYYENKNTQDHKYYYVEYNQAIVDEIVSDIKFVISHIDAGTLPEREFQPTSFDCRYCDYRDICHPVMNSYNLNGII
jgi:CRISPR/Cas system-associated exonuclease Cas4 (RecB family)